MRQSTLEERNRALLKYLQKVADRNGYVLNPDEKALGRITSFMADNKVSYGKYFCPCKHNYPLNVDSDPICPCITLKDEILRDGYCECHVFFNPDAAHAVKRGSGLLSTVTCPG